MAFPHSLLFRFSTCFQRISPLLLWLLLLMRVDALHRSDEVQTLLNFKASMAIDNGILGFLQKNWVNIGNSGGDWSYWSTWKDTDNTPCNWVGVSCTTNFTVQGLDFQAWELYQLTSESLEILSNLTDLRVLDFAFNSLGTGFPYTIPDTIQTLTGLEKLNLPYNSFTGPLPANISACRNLRHISIEGNHLTGDMHSLRGLENLEVLLLRNNRFSGPFPKELGELTTLVNIDLSGNMFSGSIPSLPNLTSLLDLQLHDNNFTEFEGPLFPGMESLERLSVAGNQLEGTIPPRVRNLVNLKHLDMSRNKLSGKIPFGFSQQLKNGIKLDLSQNQFEGTIPADLLQPELSNNYPVSMNLSYNYFSGNIPLNGSKPYKYLVLDLSHNNLSGQVPSIYSNMHVYASLWLQNNLLSGDIVNFLGDSPGLVNLTELRLENNFFSGDLSRIANVNTSFPYLQSVDLSNNDLRMSTTGAISNPLRAVLDFFSSGGYLTDFRVGGNNFTGTSLPQDFGNYDLLELLDLSNNHLTGALSGAAFNSTFLPALQLLNLSYNDATGSLPKSIIMLPFLTTLDVTHNRLSGQLPYIPPNSRLYNQTFYGNNSDLCGGPLRSCSRNKLQWWVWPIVVGSLILALGSCLVATWRWKVYHKRHQQDADLIKTLMERESTTLMSLRELKKATDNFATNAQIGEGGFGTVYTGKLSDGTIVAIKRSKREGSEMDKQQFLNEVRILSQVNHRNLVKLLGCCMENKVALLVFEFISNGTLQEHLQGLIGEVRLSWKQRLTIATQTAEALNYLHSAAAFPIYHRDVKSANILLDSDFNAKVSDFGISRLAPLQATHVSTIAIKGTIGYIDPEYYTSYKLTDKSDVYSFGVVLLELISAKPAVDFLRGTEGTSLVTFATPHIERGDLRQLIDPTLTQTYTDPSGRGRESILNLGRLAITCLDKQSDARPSMKEVWKELQGLWLELEGVSSWSLPSTKEDDDEGPLFQILL